MCKFNPIWKNLIFQMNNNQNASLKSKYSKWDKLGSWEKMYVTIHKVQIQVQETCQTNPGH